MVKIAEIVKQNQWWTQGVEFYRNGSLRYLN